MVKIGVIVNHLGEIVTLTEGSSIQIYEQKDLNWVNTRNITYKMEIENNIGEVRKVIKELINQLEDCKILVGSIIIGVPFMVLDNEGIMMCEAEQFSYELLNTIATDYEAGIKKSVEENLKEKEEYPTSPYEVSCGIYELDLRKMQKIHPEISSKMALIPFLKKGRFHGLEIYCEHVMPWLEWELKSYNQSFESTKLENGGYKVLIKPI